MERKYSIYNNIITIDNRHTLIYNSFSGKYVVVKNKVFSCPEELIKQLEKNPRFYNNLLDAGVIVDPAQDECEKLKDRIIEGIQNTNEYILHINPTLDCNFNCWYCYENHIKNSCMNEIIQEGVNNFIRAKCQDTTIRTLRIGFFGGEPLLRFQEVVKPILMQTAKTCNEYGIQLRVQFTTNGYLVTKDVLETLAKFDCGFQITLDGGRECHDKTRFLKGGTGSFNTIVSNIIRLASYGHHVIVRVNYTSKNIESVSGIYDSFANLKEDTKRYISFDFQRVWQDKESKDDITEQTIAEIRNFFILNKFAVHSNYIPQDVRFPCYGDKINHVLINYNGDVFGCTARDFCESNRIGVLQRSGIILFDTKILETRLTAKYSKEICQTCRIAPICGGGCAQKAFESRDSTQCTLGYSEIDKDAVIINLLDHNLASQALIY